MSVEVFGEIKTGAHVEAALISTIEEWIETYLAEVERQASIEARKLPAPRSYSTVNEFRKWPEEQIPAVVVVSPGLATSGIMVEGNGQVNATFLAGIAVVVSAKDKASTNMLAKSYAAAIRTLILQHPSLGGFSRGVTLLDESYNDGPPEDERTLGAAQVQFEVEVPDVSWSKGGLTAPPDDPYDPDPTFPTVDETDVTINKEAVDA